MLPLALLPPLLLAALGLAACGGGEEAGPPVTTDAAAERGAFNAAATALGCSDPLIDYHEVWEGAILEGEFELEVQGREPLVIRAMRADCGCAAPLLEVLGAGGETSPAVMGDPLAPGTRLRLQVSYDTRGRIGKIPRKVNLYCNQAGGVAIFTLVADVRPWLRVDPPSLSAGVMSVEEERSLEFQVQSSTGERYLLEHVRRAVPDTLQVLPTPVEPDAEGRAARWTVALHFTKGMPKGVHRYPIHLRTDRPHPEVAIGDEGVRRHLEAVPELEVEVVGHFRIQPSALDFGIVRGDETVGRTLRLTCLDPDGNPGEPRARLVPLKADRPFPLERTALVTVAPIEGENAWNVQLLLQGLDKDVEQMILARLVIETGHPAEPVIETRISGIHHPASPKPPSGASPTPRER